MTGRDLQVVFGTGQVGLALAHHLASSGSPLPAVSRHRPTSLAQGVDWCGADAGDPEAATDAAKGASVIYQCVGAPYTQWPKQFPPLQRAVVTSEQVGVLEGPVLDDGDRRGIREHLGGPVHRRLQACPCRPGTD